MTGQADIDPVGVLLTTIDRVPGGGGYGMSLGPPLNEHYPATDALQLLVVIDGSLPKVTFNKSYPPTPAGAQSLQGDVSLARRATASSRSRTCCRRHSMPACWGL